MEMQICHSLKQMVASFVSVGSLDATSFKYNIIKISSDFQWSKHTAVRGIPIHAFNLHCLIQIQNNKFLLFLHLSKTHMLPSAWKVTALHTCHAIVMVWLCYGVHFSCIFSSSDSDRLLSSYWALPKTLLLKSLLNCEPSGAYYDIMQLTCPKL